MRRDECHKRLASWQHMCGGGDGAVVELRPPPSTAQQPRGVAATQCSPSFLRALEQGGGITPSTWPASGLLLPDDATHRADDVNATIRAIEAGADASRLRQEHAPQVRRAAARLRGPHERLLCRSRRRGEMVCSVVPTAFGPPIGATPRADLVAVVLAGAPRSFLSAPAQQFWRTAVHALREDAKREPVVLAVMSEVSVPTGNWNVGERHNVSDLDAALAALGADYRALFFGGSSWADAAGQCCAPTLRSSLLPSGWARHHRVPVNFGYQRRTVALDLMLRYEAEAGEAFAHVLALRPDVLYPPLIDSRVIGAMWSVREAVVMVNDQLAIAPRALAGLLLVSGSMHRVVFGEPPEAWPVEAVAQLHASLLRGASGSLAQPTTFLALHGVLFGGLGLEFEPSLLPVSDIDGGAAHPLARRPHPVCANTLLRQLPPVAGDSVDSPVCLKRRELGEPCLKELRRALQARGIRLDGSLGICEELEQRRRGVERLLRVNTTGTAHPDSRASEFIPTRMVNA